MDLPQRPFLALGLRIVSAFLFATLLVLVKYASQSGVALPEIMFWRQAVSIPLILAGLAMTGGLHRLRTQRLASHGKRALLGMTNMIFNFGAAILLLPAEATVLGFTTPLFAVIMAALLWREHIGPYRWAAVALGFLGVLVIAQPGGHVTSALGTGLGLLAAFFIAIINYQIRDLGRTEEPLATAFYFAAFGAPMAALALPFFYTPHSPEQWLVLVAIGLIGAVAQFLMAASLRFGAVTSVIVMDYTALIWATLYGWALWDELPSPMMWLGAPLIVAAGLIIAWREHRLGRRDALKEDTHPELRA
ncbi:DMT family transporter [Novosphingobium sp. JCM 18896]|uniref:DMT family transporter n=1 Tax=Novosphingobium sp. JCM 18896 TaxID=2989731 RepID=UPI0022219E0D|nr:DMT family transporter [Novosphingobium sp. JCM 18896]MCW1427933.1 DMT family transporter [Novosphingobium sp. JCM 18896]